MPFTSLGSLFSSANNEASSSRKRSYAEIARSESRSQSPQRPSSKRRRTNPLDTPFASASRFPSYSPATSTPQPDFTERYEGDGLDYRRPIMSASTATQTGPVLVDLTADDSPSPSQQPPVVGAVSDGDDSRFRLRRRRQTQEEAWNAAADTEQELADAEQEMERVRAIRRHEERQANLDLIHGRNRGPRFGRDIIGEDAGPEVEVVDLMDSDEEMVLQPTFHIDDDLFGDPTEPSSPEITFVGERPAPGADNILRAPSRLTRRLPTPQDRRGPPVPNTFQNLRDFVRHEGYYRALSDNEIDEAREALDRETLDRIDGIREARPNHRNRERAQSRIDEDMRDRRMQLFGDFPIARAPRAASIGIPDFIDVEELEMDLEMNYETPAFQVGDPDRLEIIDPLPWPVIRGAMPQPMEQGKELYNIPPARAMGFTMNFTEEDCLECPSCHEELSVGEEGSAKAQVWMVKNCGHVYCGECTINRAVTKQKKGKARMVETNVTPFKKCLVRDCGRSVVAKAAMFQVYL